MPGSYHDRTWAKVMGRGRQTSATGIVTKSERAGINVRRQQRPIRTLNGLGGLRVYPPVDQVALTFNEPTDSTIYVDTPGPTDLGRGPVVLEIDVSTPIDTGGPYYGWWRSGPEVSPGLSFHYFTTLVGDGPVTGTQFHVNTLGEVGAGPAFQVSMPGAVGIDLGLRIYYYSTNPI